MKLSQKEKQDFANELAKNTDEVFADNDGFRNAYSELGEWDQVPNELHYSLYAIHPEDVVRIKKAFPEMIIGG